MLTSNMTAIKNATAGKALIFIDEGNLVALARDRNRSIDWLKLVDYLSEGKVVLETVVYAGLPPNVPMWESARQKKEGFLRKLEALGFLVERKNGKPANDSYKANVDVMMAIDATDLSVNIRPDVVVLVTGDGDFACLALKLRRMGIKVEVAGIKGRNLAQELEISANKVIDLTDWLNACPQYDTSLEPV